MTAAEEYDKLAYELYALIAAGKGDSPEAEALCERMDAPWYAMTAEEQAKARHSHCLGKKLD